MFGLVVLCHGAWVEVSPGTHSCISHGICIFLDVLETGWFPFLWKSLFQSYEFIFPENHTICFLYGGYNLQYKLTTKAHCLSFSYKKQVGNWVLFTINNDSRGSSLVASQLRIWHCYFHSSGSIPGRGTSEAKNKQTKKKQQLQQWFNWSVPSHIYKNHFWTKKVIVFGGQVELWKIFI